VSIFGLDDGTRARLATPGIRPISPAWTPDDRSVVVLLSGVGKRRISSFEVTSGAEQTLLTTGSRFMILTSIAPDGTLVLDHQAPGGLYDIVLLPKGGSETRAYVATAAEEHNGQVSPDGRFLAYSSTVSGRTEIYADTFPERRQAVRVSIDGSQDWSAWRDDGREIYFLSSGATSTSMMVCDVRTTPSLEIGKPRVLFDLPGDHYGVIPAPHGDRFLVFRRSRPRQSAVILVQNWQSQLASHD
jgi:Tol biopolymer transport system component